MAEVASAFVTLLPSAKGFGKATEAQISGEMTAAGKSSGGKMSGAMGAALTTGAKAVGVGAGGILGAALFKGFNRLSSIENAQAKLKGLGNSAKTVDSIMKNALASVKGTAFGLDEAATVAAGAVASGIKPGKQLETNLKLVADAATIGGTSMGEMGAIFNKVAASGKLQGDVIAQLGDRGIPILQLLGKELGKTPAEVSKLASQGKIDFQTFSDAMQSGLGGAALKSGDTTTGAFKNMGAAIGRVGASLLSGVFPKLKGGFGSITAALDGIEPKAKIAGAVIGTALAFAATTVGNAATAIGAVVSFIDSNQTTFKVLAGIITALLIPAFVMWGVQATIAAAKNVVAWVTSKAGAVSSIAFQVAGMTLIAAGWVMVGVQALLGAAKVAAAWLIALGPIGLAIAVIALVVVLIIKYWDQIKAATVAVWNAVKNAVSKAVSGVVNFVKSHWPLLLAIITGPIGLAVLFVVRNWAKIKGATVAAFNAVKSAISGAMNAVKSTVSNAVGNVLSIFRGLLGKIKGALSGAGSALKGIGKNIVQGLINGIKSMGGAISRALVALLPGPLKKFAGKLGIASPSKVFRDFGLNIGEGLVIGIDKTQGDVTAASSRLASSVSMPSGASFDTSANATGAGGAGASGVALTQNIYPQPKQSEPEIGRHAANALLWKMAS